MNETLYQAATLIVPVVLAIVFHEVAHGWVARLLGDPTAHRMGRLSLNPIRHVDPIGTVVLPGALALAGLPVFGWAKPVPVDYRRLRHPKRDMAIVGAAGPGANLILATLTAIAIGLLVRASDMTVAPGPVTLFIAENLKNFLLVNLFLGVFNLLPLPPFDGSRILRGLLPDRGAAVMDKIEPIGIPLFFAVFVLLPWAFPGLHLVDRIVIPPVSWLLEHFQALAALVAGAEPQ
ncbi:MAG: site-2 protease family protein [Novosphingobium sp. 12-64-8]|nr:MAG: site-2 protease family protein [Novosphingobium sp. 12-64-8]